MYINKFQTVLVLLLAIVFVKCKSTGSDNSIHSVEPTLTAKSPLLELVEPEQSGIDFENRIIETYEVNITTNIGMYNGGGLAILDVNNDGLPDIYFIGSSGKNGLYLNEGGFRFKDITESSGVVSDGGFETAATAVDVNADGFLDIYVCRDYPQRGDIRKNKLFINNGDLTFSEKAAEYGLDDASASTGANFFDFDNDGDLDLYLLNHPEDFHFTNKLEAKLGPEGKYEPDLSPHSELDSDRLYRNDDGHFTDVSKEAGIWNFGFGLSVSVTDFNYDGWVDILVGNDFIHPDHLYINNQDGTFTDKLGDYFRHTTQHTMGTDLSDFDGDGLVDLFAADMFGEHNYRQKIYVSSNPWSNYINLIRYGYFEPVVRNVLQRNNGNGTFSDVGCVAGVFKTDWSWSGLLFDMDNDGLRDLHVTNGYRRETNNRDFIGFTLPEIGKAAGSGKKLREIYPDIDEFLKIIPTTKLRNYVFANQGDWQFENTGGQWMTIEASWSCGAAWADLDADGDLDLVVNNLEQPAFVYKNLSADQKQQHYLQVQLEGTPENPFAVGASARIDYNNGEVQYAELYPTRGIFSSVEHLLHFGLGAAKQVDKLTVRWPNGQTLELNDVPADQRLKLNYADARLQTTSIVKLPVNRAIFQPVEASAGLNFIHSPNLYDDREIFPLLPWTVSDQDPIMAKGDINGDGLEDFFVGNSFDQPAQVFAQKPNGTFEVVSPDLWATESIYKDHGALFFDADGDDDQDLLVFGGGPEAKKEVSDVAWATRLYINTDGKGTLQRVPNAVPAFGGNLALRAAAYDYDNDGDPDVFCGGRLLPDQWPITPRSVVLRNDNGQLTDVTSSVAPDFEHCGMVTDLTWTNLDGDPELELVVVGEWMPVSIFDWQKGKLKNVTADYGLDKSNGLWYRLAVADLDGDGDNDLVTGNLGLNTRLTASPEGPLTCYAKDFDGNGDLDLLMAYFEDGKEYPLYQKEVLHQQMPILKKRLLYAKDYANATIEDVWPRKDLDQAFTARAYHLESCWWENKDGKFVKHVLPIQVQLSPVQGIATIDVNGDGNLDVLLVGNKYGYEVETNRCDSSNGCVLIGDGKGGFSWMNNAECGFWAMREVRDLIVLNGKEPEPHVIISNRGAGLQAYKLSPRPVQ
jgi:hypothetical protein